ncbi:MAG: 16S rRNA (guanine(966)-N(2))-methyltransferase RsmD [Paracoccaceae bacterium]
MRIIAGAFKGRALASVGKGDAGAHLRPTTDRVRESLFNVLGGGRFGDPIGGARVLDIFAGTGALGLEALSRGAAQVCFVEDGRVAQKILTQNIALCEAKAACRIYRRDARKLPTHEGAPFDLVFLDPPYGKQMGEAALRAALAGGWIDDQALIVWEESAAITAPEGWQVLDARKYGGTVISLLEKA